MAKSKPDPDQLKEKLAARKKAFPVEVVPLAAIPMAVRKSAVILRRRNKKNNLDGGWIGAAMILQALRSAAEFRPARRDSAGTLRMEASSNSTR